MMESYFKGVAGSRRIAIGRAIVLLKSNLIIPRYTIERSSKALENEIEKLATALSKTIKQLEHLKTELIQK